MPDNLANRVIRIGRDQANNKHQLWFLNVTSNPESKQIMKLVFVWEGDSNMYLDNAGLKPSLESLFPAQNIRFGSNHIELNFEESKFDPKQVAKAIELISPMIQHKQAKQLIELFSNPLFPRFFDIFNQDASLQDIANQTDKLTKEIKAIKSIKDTLKTLFSLKNNSTTLWTRLPNDMVNKIGAAANELDEDSLIKLKARLSKPL